MNENIAHIVNTEIMSAHAAVMFKRKSSLQISEEAQRIKVIAELAELYDAYQTFGSGFMVDVALRHYEAGQMDQACEAYRSMIKDTAPAELADVFLATLTLKMIRGEGPWKPKSPNRGETSTFIKMIRRVAEGMEADQVLDWCLVYAHTHDVDLAVHLRLKVAFNATRTDWL